MCKEGEVENSRERFYRHAIVHAGLRLTNLPVRLRAEHFLKKSKYQYYAASIYKSRTMQSTG